MGAISQKTILITGATGFIGRRLVSICRTRGYRVRVVVRNSKTIPAAWLNDAGLEIVLADLAVTLNLHALTKAVSGADALIHTAGALLGTDTDHEAATHQPLHNILTALREARTRCASLVLASSFSVYGIGQQTPGTVVAEDTPTEEAPQHRDAYCRAKLAAEMLSISVCTDIDVDLTIVRPGVVFGPDKIWNAHLGFRIGRVGVLLERDGEVPLCHVSHCAEVLIRAAETSMSRDTAIQRRLPYRVYNVVDSQLPSRLDYALKLKKIGLLNRVIDFSWVPINVAAKVLHRGGVKTYLPGLLRRETLAYRLQPMRFSNAKIREELDWKQQFGLDDLLNQTVETLETEAAS